MNTGDKGRVTDNYLYMTGALRNLVYNHDFRYFSHAKYNVVPVDYGSPDGWIYDDDGPGGSIALNQEQTALEIKTSNDDTSMMTFRQALHEFPRWREMLCGEQVSAALHTTIPANCTVYASITDGITTHAESWCNTTGGKHVFELSFDIGKEAKNIYISLNCQANAAVIEISRIYANIGAVATQGLECIVNGVIGETKQYLVTENAPAEELSLCTKGGPRELTENETRLNSVVAGRFGLGANNRSMLPDMRGYFVRVWNNGATIDPDAKDRKPLGDGSKNTGDHVGTWQEDEFKEHLHEIKFSPGTEVTGGKETILTPVNKLKKDETEKTGGQETRGKNVYQLFTMKWA